ncbi:MAG: hypothetical protein U0641_02285 [Anaerolineae bacterium]
MKRVAVIMMLAVALASVFALTGAASVTNAAQAGENTAASSTALVGGCYRIPLTISFPALYAASNPVNNMPTLWVMDNGNGAVIYKALIASGAKSVTIPNTLTGRSYYIRIGFDRNPPLEPFAAFYWPNGWNGTAGGQTLEAYLPGITTNVTVPCQSGAAGGVPAQPVTITVRPPTGVIAGYLGDWATGTAPTWTISNSGSLGPHYEWTGLPTRPAAGVTIELWRAPSASNQAGALLARTVTNTEGYFNFTKVDPSQAYELKFTRNNATYVVSPVVATYSGQLYQVNATNGALFVPGAAFLPAR